jgi:hypothetical protein
VTTNIASAVEPSHGAAVVNAEQSNLSLAQDFDKVRSRITLLFSKFAITTLRATVTVVDVPQPRRPSLVTPQTTTNDWALNS